MLILIVKSQSMSYVCTAFDLQLEVVTGIILVGSFLAVSIYMELLNWCNLILGLGTLDGGSRYGKDDEADTGSSVFVKYNRMLHGKKTERGRKRDTLTIKFLKKYIHYAKHRIQPELTDEVVIFSFFFLSIYILYSPVNFHSVLCLQLDNGKCRFFSWCLYGS